MQQSPVFKRFKCFTKTINKQASTGKDLVLNEMETLRQSEAR